MDRAKQNLLRLAKQYFKLLSTTEREEVATNIDKSLKSFCSLFGFMKMCPNLKCPVISLTPEYNIYATWKSARNKVFSIHFLSGSDVRFVIFTPGKPRFSGTTTIDALIGIVKPYGVLNWASYGGN